MNESFRYIDPVNPYQILGIKEENIQDIQTATKKYREKISELNSRYPTDIQLQPEHELYKAYNKELGEINAAYVTIRKITEARVSHSEDSSDLPKGFFRNADGFIYTTEMPSAIKYTSVEKKDGILIGKIQVPKMDRWRRLVKHQFDEITSIIDFYTLFPIGKMYKSLNIINGVYIGIDRDEMYSIVDESTGEPRHLNVSKNVSKILVEKNIYFENSFTSLKLLPDGNLLGIWYNPYNRGEQDNPGDFQFTIDPRTVCVLDVKEIKMILEK